MSINTPDILKGIVLLAGVAHVMLYFDGYWHDVFWLTAILSVGIPLIIYKKTPKPKKRKTQKVSKERPEIKHFDD